MGAPYIYDISRLRVKQVRVLQFVPSLQTTLYLNFSANGISNRYARFLFLEQIIYSGKVAMKCSLLPPNVYTSDDR